MISIREYNKEDLLLIKVRLLIFVMCVILAGGIFWGTRYIENSAVKELQQTRNEMDNVRSAIATIQADEVTVKNYIDTYRSLQTKGVVGTEDRLQLLELLAQIRTQHELFPVNLNIGQQAELNLAYQNTAGSTGQSVKLRSSVLEISFALLHEEDLSRFLDDILGDSQFLQPAACQLSANNVSNTNYYFLDKHFTASCSLYWYTFNVSAAAGAQP